MGTESSFSPASIQLSAPSVRLFNQSGTYQAGSGLPGKPGVEPVTVLNRVEVVLAGLTDEFFRSQPQLELLRYRQATSVLKPNQVAKGRRSAKYVHPSNGDTPDNGRDMRGGAQDGTHPDKQAIRQSEWALASRNDVIDVTQGMCGYMGVVENVRYRDSSGSVGSTFTGVVPSGRTQYLMGRRYPYPSRHSPGYYAFRFSVVDPHDPRGGRISGPPSSVVSLHTDVFAFDPEPEVGGRACASLAPGYDPTVWRARIVSRLP